MKKDIDINYVETLMEQEGLSWEGLAFHADMSEAFMRKAIDKLEWSFVVRNPLVKLSPSFIEEVDFHGLMDWDGLFEYHPLPMWFMDKHIDKADPRYIPARYFWWKDIKNKTIKKMASFIKSKRVIC
jgi:hypothetical protein